MPSNWTPLAGLNGVTPLGEEHEEDDTLISATLGFRYAFGNGKQWHAGVQFPISDSEA